MNSSLQKTSGDIKSKKDIDSGVPASSRDRRKLRLDELLDKFENAQGEKRANFEDRKWVHR